MLKKILFSAICLATTAASAFDYPIYLGGTAKYQKVGANYVNYSALFPSLSIGIGDWFNEWFYLAAEAFADFRPVQFTNETYNNYNIRIRWDYGGSIIPGIYLDDVLTGYLRLGMVSADFDQLDTWKSGYQAGVGLDAKLNRCWDVRAEYDYTRFNAMDTLGKAIMHVVSVGVIYRFTL